MSGGLSAIVLSGGRATRLGGVDKGALVVGDGALLDGVLDAVLTAVGDPRRVVLVGEGPAVARVGVGIGREEPAFGGPLAALGAGLAMLADGDGDGDEILVLACDLPRAAELVPLLTGAATPDDSDGVVVLDGEGRHQWLAARYRTATLREAVDAVASAEGALTGLPLRVALGRLRLTPVADPTGASRDVDTPQDLTAARAAAMMDARREESR